MVEDMGSVAHPATDAKQPAAVQGAAVGPVIMPDVAVGEGQTAATETGLAANGEQHPLTQPAVPQESPSAYKSILEWSTSRPDWQRDALRRIVKYGALKEDARKEVLALFFQENGLADAGTPPLVAEPLAEAHLPGATSGKTIRLKSLGNLQNVNLIASDQTIEFGPTGLTVIYGANGSGKSGYARVLKKACATRGEADAVLPNVFADPTPAEKAKAAFVLEVDGVEKTVNWLDDESAGDDLRSIFVFDSATARNYVSGKESATFTPAGLDVLEKLAGLMRWMKDEVEGKRKQLEQIINSFTWPTTENLASAPPMVAAKMVDTIAKLEADELLSGLTRVEVERENQLRTSLADDPQKNANEAKNKHTRLKETHEALIYLSNVLSDSVKESHEVAFTKLSQAKDAAVIASRMARVDSDLNGTYGETWSTLWTAARKFAVESFGVSTDAPAASDPKCVYCQQDLAADARSRLARFDEFVRGEANDAAKAAATALLTLKENVGDVNAKLQMVRTGLRDLPDQELRPAFESLLTLLVKRVTFLDWVHGDRDSAKPDWPEVDSELVTKLGGIVATAESDATQAAAAIDLEARRRMKHELDRLSARQWLHQHAASIKEHVKMKELLARLNNAKSSLDTTQVTKKNGELAVQVLTEAFKSAFKNEMKWLFRSGNLHSKAEIKESGSHGKRSFEIALVGAADGAKPLTVASEGEQRCIALAAALAEIEVAGSTSPIVFDDPVSSLDHMYRRRVAEHLCSVAVNRQVIVFTHDMVFLSALVRCLGQSGSKPTLLSIEQVNNRAGIVDSKDPGRDVKKRIKELRLRLDDFLSKWRDSWTGGGTDYRNEARAFCSALRAAWERGIEEVLLAGIVRRFEPDVQTKNRLKRASRNLPEFFETPDEAMTWTSEHLEGHDEADPVQLPPPSPDDLSDRVTQLDEWYQRVDKRQRG